jgi:predicted amino acid dehydrogenase
LRSLTKRLAWWTLAAAIFCGPVSAVALAFEPSVADLDAEARAAGNRKDIAEHIGVSIFSTQWSAEVSQVSANEMGKHLIVGIRIWGVKFHRPLSREEFVDEVVSITKRVFSAAPNAEEVDFWASVPIVVGRDVVVNGDLARPTTKTVFAMTVAREESEQSQQQRALRTSDGVYWDEEWAHDALRPAS